MLLVIAGIIIAAGLRSQPIRDPAITEYAAVYQEYYPHTVRIVTHMQERKSYEVWFTTSISSTEVFSWYEQQYLQHGWMQNVQYTPVNPEDRYRWFFYDLDTCRSLWLTVEYHPEDQSYRHIMHLNELRMCRRVP
jgi:hypothetical protein